MLSGNEIVNAINNKLIVIEPFNLKQVNPNSYNLTLGSEIVKYTDSELDCNKKNDTKTIKLTSEGYTLSPGELYIVNSNEYTENEHYIPQISGRSSIGRIGLTVHVCAGFGSIGFRGKWTFMITCLVPTKVFPGMEIGQIYFFEAVGDKNIRYEGKYNNQSSPAISYLYKEKTSN